MPRITINGQQIETQTGKTIMQAARDNGIYIPHYCWHPGLSIAGNCRMCLVEVEKSPKPAIACATQVADGMVVRTDSPMAAAAQKAVMEFLLINHPLDCPICDEAGQCKLQDYTMAYSEGISRFDEEKVHKPKRQIVGPNVMLDDERCIMCSRCVRFAEEIAHQPSFTFTQRNDRVALTVFPDEPFDNAYSMNVIDICPVGALTSRDFRFKSRVWDMSWTDTICPGCARGCNISLGARNNAILRVDPRQNQNVNAWWICDFGRLESWRHVNASTRIPAPYMRENGETKELAWNDAFAKAAALLKKFKASEIAFVASPFATNEDNFLLHRLAAEVVHSQTAAALEHLSGEDDDLLIRADKTPNTLGARLTANNATSSIEAVLEGVAQRRIKALYVLDEDVAVLQGAGKALEGLETLIVQSANENATTRVATLVLAANTFAEVEGTFTNFEGFVQLLAPAIATQENRSRAGMRKSRLDKFGSQFDRWAQSNKSNSLPHWKIVQGVARQTGAAWRFASPEEIFAELARKIPAFAGLSYEILEESNGVYAAKQQFREKQIV